LGFLTKLATSGINISNIAKYLNFEIFYINEPNLRRDPDLWKYDNRAAIGKNTKALRASVCGPASCSAQDLSLLVTGFLFALNPETPALALVNDDDCFTAETEFQALDTWSIIFLSTAGLLVGI
jgi:hypothetical protein